MNTMSPQIMEDAEQSTKWLRRPWRPWELHKFTDKEIRLQSNELRNRKCFSFLSDSKACRMARIKHLEKKESCTICNQVFTRKDNLTRHMKLAHDKSQKPYCKFCQKCFSRQDATQRHEMTCTQNPNNKIKTFTVEQPTTSYLTHKERLHNKYLNSLGQTKPKIDVIFKNECMKTMETALEALEPDEKITITLTK